MDFDDRLKNAIQRGKNRKARQTADAQAKALSQEELKRLHTQYRLELSDYLETCIARLAHHFPGFQTETLYGEKGWGAACKRDDLLIQAGRRSNNYSRLELTIRPHSSLNVVELTGKGTIRNKEVFNRNYFEKIEDVDVDKFKQLIDAWSIEYAEQYAARS